MSEYQEVFERALVESGRQTLKLTGFEKLTFEELITMIILHDADKLIIDLDVNTIIEREYIIIRPNVELTPDEVFRITALMTISSEYQFYKLILIEDNEDEDNAQGNNVDESSYYDQFVHLPPRIRVLPTISVLFQQFNAYYPCDDPVELIDLLRIPPTKSARNV